MTPQTKEELKTLLINAGYEKELDDILFIEDIEPLEIGPLDLEFDDELLDLDFNIEPIEFDELYWYYNL